MIACAVLQDQDQAAIPLHALHGLSVAGCDSWRCCCGNEPHLDGFLVRDEDEPETYVLAPGQFLCGGCSRIYDENGVEVGRW